MKTKFSDRKIQTKLTITMSTISTIIIVIILSIFLIRDTTNTVDLLDSRFETALELNAKLIENKFYTARSVAQNLASYLEDHLASNNDYSDMVTSSVYNNLLIPSELADTESYLVNNMWGSITEDRLVNAIGVYFEPYIFSSNKEIYAFDVSYLNLNNNQLKVYQNYNDYALQEYYQVPKSSGEIFVSNTWVNAYGEHILSVSVPVIINGSVAGVVVADISLSAFDDTILVDENYPSIVSAVFNSKFEVIYDSSSADKAGMSISELLSASESNFIFEQLKYGHTFSLETDYIDNKVYTRYYTPVDAFNETWWVHLGIDNDEAYGDLRLAIVVISTLGVVALIISTLVISRIIKHMLAPLSDLSQVASNISAGNLSAQSNIVNNDDIGQIIQQFNFMSAFLKQIISEIDLVLTEIAKGNLIIESNVKSNYAGDFSVIKTSLLSISTQLRQTLSQINLSSTEVSSQSEEIANSAMSLAESCNSQTDILSDFVLTTENMVAAVSEVNLKISETTSTGEEAKEIAIQGEQAMNEMLIAMSTIAESSRTISSILSIIQDISTQTNLLALNASIEAARAGEAGKGFSVVANEIRDLATRSSDTTKQIEDIINTSLTDVAKGQDIVNETAKHLVDVSSAIGKSVSLSSELLQMSQSQKQSIDLLATNIMDISDGVTSNAAAAEANTAVSQELSAQAQHLERLVRQFKF
ncbi:MAG: hypothetical protein ATN34_04865 [Epulopiscium sp. Nele67-Bin002]|nr:MAG: hypothetical protein ATN34_04865 [Epulopiscium sp. Nele67-Bin002]